MTWVKGNLHGLNTLSLLAVNALIPLRLEISRNKISSRFQDIRSARLSESVLKVASSAEQLSLSCSGLDRKLLLFKLLTVDGGFPHKLSSCILLGCRNIEEFTSSHVRTLLTMLTQRGRH